MPELPVVLVSRKTDVAKAVRYISAFLGIFICATTDTQRASLLRVSIFFPTSSHIWHGTQLCDAEARSDKIETYKIDSYPTK
jgi:hypothetical protein